MLTIPQTLGQTQDWFTRRIAAQSAAIKPVSPQFRAMNLDGGEIYDLDTIRQSVRIILTSRPGDVPQRLTFGSRLPFLLDLPLSHTNRDRIRAETARAIATWEPRVTVRGVVEESDPTSGQHTIRVNFSPAGQVETFEVVV